MTAKEGELAAAQQRVGELEAELEDVKTALGELHEL